MLKKLQDFLIYLDKETEDGVAIVVGCVCAIIGILTFIGCIKLIASIEYDVISSLVIITNIFLYVISLIVSFLIAFISGAIIGKWIDDEETRRGER